MTPRIVYEIGKHWVAMTGRNIFEVCEQQTGSSVMRKRFVRRRQGMRQAIREAQRLECVRLYRAGMLDRTLVLN